MKKVILYIAMSLDGFIADKNGDVSWLKGDGSEVNNLGSYEEFIKTIDTVVLGHRTYHQLVTELSPDKWVYEDKITYVITHKKIEDKMNIIFTDNLMELVTRLKDENGKDIWICGGAEIADQLIKADMIDKYCITIIPTLLGDGIRLFHINEQELQLKLVSTRSYNGMTDLVFERRQ